MSNITLTIPNDDHIALRAFGKALEEMALAHGAEPVELQTYCNVTFNDENEQALREKLKTVLGEPQTDTTAALERLNTATGELMKAAPRMMQEARFDGEELQGKRKDPQTDTTAQQVKALGVSTEVLSTLAKLESSNTPQPAQGLIQTEEGQFNLSTGEQVDSTGTPWDERIHSTSKALNADGTWRLRRKPKDMDEAEWADYVSMIKADLQYPVECGGQEEESAGGDLEENEQISNENNNIVPAEVEPPVTPPGDDFHTDAGVVTEQTVAGIPPIPVPPPVVVPPSHEQVENAFGDDYAHWAFPKLMTFLTERQGKIDVPTVNMLLAQDGIASLPELNVHPDKIGPFVARVKAHLGE
ncbi:hypothetical protein [Phage vB_KsaM-C1]|nr:hypothetical protein [Phage vB_KsaM-C1]